MRSTMPRPRRALLAVPLLVAGCSTSPGNAAPGSVRTDSATIQAVSASGFTTTTLATLDQPWAAEFLPGTDYLAITQRGGKLLLRNQASGKVLNVTGVPRVLAAGQGGLGDIVVAPGYNNRTNRTVYLTWAEAGSGGTAGAVMGRGTLEIGATSARLTGLKVIWRQSPKVTGRGHYSHRIAFSPDGKYLFLTSGERQKFTPAQDLSNNLGKVLRLNPDGTAAKGNSFANRGGVSAQIWSYGHRNLLGIAFDGAGRLWESEMGPKGGDEINLIQPGKNYGWPKASNGSNYDGTPIPDHKPGDGFVAPKVWWNPSISPGSLMIYSGTMFPQWRGDAFVGALSGQALIRVDLNGASAKKAEQWPMRARIRDVVQGPDGALYVLEDGAGGRLLRLSAKP